MIVSHINIESELHTVLVVVIGKDNLERMKFADPITLESESRGGQMMGQGKVKFPNNLSLLIAYEEDEEALKKIAAGGNLGLFLKYLERGRIWVPGVDGSGAELIGKARVEPVASGVIHGGAAREAKGD